MKINKILCGLVAALLLLPKSNSLAAEEPVKNSVYLEALGAGFTYSINYERLFSERIAARIGAALTPLTGTWSFKNYAASAPLTASYLIGQGSHKFETGAGIHLTHSVNENSGEGLLSSDDGFEVYGLGLAGYRFQPSMGGLQIRLGANLFVGQSVAQKFESSSSFLIWPYLSAGYSF